MMLEGGLKSGLKRVARKLLVRNEQLSAQLLKRWEVESPPALEQAPAEAAPPPEPPPEPVAPPEPPPEAPPDASAPHKLDYHGTYAQHVANLQSSGMENDVAMSRAIGGEFETMGILERELLIQHGLPKDGYVIDVGCGSGRLAKPLAEYLEGDYLGIDVVPELLAHARSLVAERRPTWRFEKAEGLTIPEKDGVADIVCFFSVLTHLLHEESYAYLREAKRVLKPTGKIIFSFLEFSRPSHWNVFESNLAAIGTSEHLNQFISRDGIRAWARHLGLKVEATFDGDKSHIPVPHPLKLDDGRVWEKMGRLGQSVCVLSLP